MTFFNADKMMFSQVSLAFSMMLVLGSGSALADPYSSLDSDQDGDVTQLEYNSYMQDDTRRYEGWDQNKDMRLDESEWNDANPDHRNDFNSWDSNQDGYLDNNEFYDGSFNSYDNDNDGLLNEDEVGSAADDGLLD